MCLFGHKWRVLSNYQFGNELLKLRGFETNNRQIMNNLTTRGIITVVQCERCGKIKHIKTIL